MVEHFSASQFWNEVRRRRATHIHYLGGVLPMLLKQPARADHSEDFNEAARAFAGKRKPRFRGR